MIKDIIATSRVSGKSTITLAKSCTTDFYTVDAGSIGYLRTKDKAEAKDYYKVCVNIQLS